MPLSSGSSFGSYEILGPLGAGGMGEVKDEATAGRLNVVLNWFSDLAR